jgi:hypothetical protein
MEVTCKQTRNAACDVKESRRSELWYSCTSHFHPPLYWVENVAVGKGCCLSYHGLTLAIGATLRLETQNTWGQEWDHNTTPVKDYNLIVSLGFMGCHSKPYVQSTLDYREVMDVAGAGGYYQLSYSQNSPEVVSRVRRVAGRKTL